MTGLAKSRGACSHNCCQGAGVPLEMRGPVQTIGHHTTAGCRGWALGKALGEASPRQEGTTPVRIRTLAVPAAALVFALGGATLTNALPGPNGNNTFGLCTAYAAGSERGQEMRNQAPPFQGLEAAAEAEDMTVAEYCAAYGTHPGQGGGNGGGNGGGPKGGDDTES